MATQNIQTVSSQADKLKTYASIALLIAGGVGYFVLANQGAWFQWGAFALAVALAIPLFGTTVSGKNLWGFGIESWKELKKVVWPERKEALQLTAFVFGFVLLMALFLWLVDKSLEIILYSWLLGWK